MPDAQSPIRTALVGLSLVLTALPAVAQDAAEPQAACERDVARLCSGNDAPDERRILACLLPDRTALSPSCRKAARVREAAVAVVVTGVRSEPRP